MAVKKIGKKTTVALAIAATVCVCGIAAHMTASEHFKTHYLPDTVVNIRKTLNGGEKEDVFCNIGYMTKEDAGKALSSYGTSIAVIERGGGIEYIEGADIKLEKDISPCLDAMLSAQKRDIGNWWKYALGMGMPDTAESAPWDEVHWTYDDNALNTVVDGLSFISDNGEGPEDAKISFNGKEFSITEEKEGHLVDAQKVRESIAAAIKEKRTTVDIDAEGCYAAPSVTKDNEELVAEKDRLNRIVTKNVHIDVIGESEVVTPDMYLPWVSYNNGSIDVDAAAVEEYVTEMSKKYKTYLSERSFTTTGGSTITVGGGRYDTYGFWMNIDDMTQILSDAIRTAEEDIVVDAPWKVPARIRNAPNGDIGDTYVEVSIEAQHLWYYVDGELMMDFDVVTGMDTPSRRTPTGVFRILWKDTEHTMKGSYGSSFCHFWLPITWEGVGIHDAYWRSSYGGDIWRGNGSHGCVNTPYEKMKRLYESITIDTPVIIY